MKKMIITIHISRDRSNMRMSWLWFSCLALLFLLPPVSFAQAHLWKYRPFRANDTDHSGGDHICDLRRDSNADGKPDRLGRYVTVSGTVIVEPSTFDTGQCLFWIREGGCGILVYGEHGNLRLGDSVTARGWLNLSNVTCFLPDVGLASLRDVALANGNVALMAGGCDYEPLEVPPRGYTNCPACYSGNIVTLTLPVKVSTVINVHGGEAAWVSCDNDSFVVYLDSDTGCSIVCGRCYLITGVVATMSLPAGLTTDAIWCVVPRCSADIVEANCSTGCRSTSWAALKNQFSNR